MKIRTVTADSAIELDIKVNILLVRGWSLLGEMQVYKEPHNHATTRVEIWDNVFSQRLQQKEANER